MQLELRAELAKQTMDFKPEHDSDQDSSLHPFRPPKLEESKCFSRMSYGSIGTEASYVEANEVARRSARRCVTGSREGCFETDAFLQLGSFESSPLLFRLGIVLEQPAACCLLLEI